MFKHLTRFSLGAAKQLRLLRRAHLRGDWKTPCTRLPNLFAGYALYELTK